LSKKKNEKSDSFKRPAGCSGRERINMLCNRIGLLSGNDKHLMKMYIENENTFRQIAYLTGVNEVTVARRIQRITKRLLDDAYITCLSNRHNLTHLDMEIAHDYFLEGLSQMKISNNRKCTRYIVRKTLKKIHSLISVESSQ